MAIVIATAKESDLTAVNLEATLYGPPFVIGRFSAVLVLRTLGNEVTSGFGSSGRAEFAFLRSDDAEVLGDILVAITVADHAQQTQSGPTSL